MSQRAIEDYVGIDASVAEFMMSSTSTEASTAMDLLRLAVSCPEHAALALLKCAVDDCRRLAKEPKP